MLIRRPSAIAALRFCALSCGMLLLTISLSACKNLNIPFTKKESSAKASGGTTRWGGFPIAIYASRDIADDSLVTSDLGAAVRYWETKAGRQLFEYFGVWNNPSSAFSGNWQSPDDIRANILYFPTEWPANGEIAGKTIVLSEDTQISGAIIMLNRSRQYCKGECANNAAPTISMRRLLTHELGHFLGLSHSANPLDIMYPTLAPSGTLSNASCDMAALQNLLQAN